MHIKIVVCERLNFDIYITLVTEIQTRQTTMFKTECPKLLKY